MKIGDYTINRNSAPFVIAEIGSNWKTKDDCISGINLAKACGADAVKFQAFTHEALYGYEDPNWEGHKYQLPIPWLEDMKAKADKVAIELMVTAFSPGLMDEVDKYVNCHKIAGSDFKNKRMLDRAISKGKPIFLSMGGHNQPDYMQVKDYIQTLGYQDVVVMYGVSDYPSKQVNLNIISKIDRDFVAGFSDHTTDVTNIPRKAVELGAVVLEKHFNPHNYSDTPDAGHSLSLVEFKNLIKSLRGEEIPEPAQNDMREKHNRRIIAIHDIAKGEELIEGKNFGVYRSKERDTKGANPLTIDRFINKKAKKDIKKGDGISLQMITD